MKTTLLSLLLISIPGWSQTPPAAAATMAAPAPAVKPPALIRLTGFLQVKGEAGPTQLFGKIKVQRCDKPTVKNSRSGIKILQKNCDAPIYFALNTAQSLPVGNYIVGFENSIYPGFVTVEADKTNSLELTKIQVPQVTGQSQNSTQYRVFRDFSTLTEQRKIYFQMYYTGKHFFKLTSRYSFGDYYLTDGQRPDNVQWRTLDLCATINSYAEAREQAKFVCQSWSAAKSMMDMADLYKFETSASLDGQFQEAWVSEPGDVQAIRHLRHLVSAPLQAGDFVSVFPGAYKIVADGRSAVSTKIVGLPPVVESYPTEDMSRQFDLDPATGAAPTCVGAETWRTDQRSYCTSDNYEGCDRATAASCQALNLDLKFRKY
jgi:hypothetical protein